MCNYCKKGEHDNNIALLYLIRQVKICSDNHGHFTRIVGALKVILFSDWCLSGQGLIHSVGKVRRMFSPVLANF